MRTIIYYIILAIIIITGMFATTILMLEVVKYEGPGVKGLVAGVAIFFIYRRKYIFNYFDKIAKSKTHKNKTSAVNTDNDAYDNDGRYNDESDYTLLTIRPAKRAPSESKNDLLEITKNQAVIAVFERFFIKGSMRYLQIQDILSNSENEEMYTRIRNARISADYIVKYYNNSKKNEAYKIAEEELKISMNMENSPQLFVHFFFLSVRLRENINFGDNNQGALCHFIISIHNQLLRQRLDYSSKLKSKM